MTNNQPTQNSLMCYFFRLLRRPLIVESIKNGEVRACYLLQLNG